MKVGIIYYSHTGNTKRVVEKINKELSNKGHSVDIRQLPTKELSDGRKQLAETPELPACERYIFASHVEAFSLEAVMKKYLNLMDRIDDKEAICYLSQGLPKKWMGAKGSLKTMKKLVEYKGANVIMTESVSFHKKFDSKQEIADVVNKIVELF